MERFPCATLGWGRAASSQVLIRERGRQESGSQRGVMKTTGSGRRCSTAGLEDAGRGCELGGAGSLQKLEKAREWISP